MECNSSDAVEADVDGDGHVDRLIHSWSSEGGAVLRVCTHEGQHDGLAGIGQAGVLATASVGDKGRVLVLYGDTSASLARAQVAVWKGDGLAVVVDRSADSPLELKAGSELRDSPDGSAETHYAWGCDDATEDGELELIQAEAHPGEGGWVTTLSAYSVTDGAASLVHTEQQHVKHPDEPLDALPSCSPAESR